MAAIQGIYAREILDSRGIPTIECVLWLDNGGIVATSVPSGTSVGKYEAHELRDKDPNRMIGKGVLQAVNNINSIIAPTLIGKDPSDQNGIDNHLIKLDGTKDKSKLGANAILAVSQAVLKAAALTANIPLYYYVLQKYHLGTGLALPSCIFSMVSGGEHGVGNLDLQEFQVIPASHHDFPTTLDIGVTLFHRLEEILANKGAIHSVGITGGFTPNLYSNTDVFEILVETIKTSRFTFAQDLFFGIDVAAEQLFEQGKYKLKDRTQAYASKELFEYYKKIRELYHVFCIEDPFHEDDTDSWKHITQHLGESTRIVGDSFLVTNMEKTQKAIEQKLCNTILVKPNQVGTITETANVIALARNAGWQVIMSHRSGETNDDIIADLAVGFAADYVKFGPPNRGERVSKYNRLLQIHQEIEHSRNQALTVPTIQGDNTMSNTTPVGADPITPVSEPGVVASPVAPAPLVAAPSDPVSIEAALPIESVSPAQPVPPAASTTPVAPTTSVETVSPVQPVSAVEPVSPVEPASAVAPVSQVTPTASAVVEISSPPTPSSAAEPEIPVGPVTPPAPKPESAIPVTATALPTAPNIDPAAADAQRMLEQIAAEAAAHPDQVANELAGVSMATEPSEVVGFPSSGPVQVQPMEPVAITPQNRT
jgi:enolase